MRALMILIGFASIIFVLIARTAGIGRAVWVKHHRGACERYITGLPRGARRRQARRGALLKDEQRRIYGRASIA